MRAIALLLLAAGCASQGPNTDWRVAGGDPGNTRFSPLDQINTTNVAQLRVAWVYHTGDLPPDQHGEIQATPIIVDGVLYTTTPALAVIALHAESGTLLWRFDPRTTHDARRTDISHVNRGVVYWADAGDVRAYDVRTGAIRWTFHAIPHPGEFGYDTWPPGGWATAGGANSWAGLSVDTVRGIVYVPTGSATPDFYGGARTGANLFANSLVALDAATGKRLWHFQTVHHDLWDRDLPAAPNFVTVTRGGAHVDAVAQIAKRGFVFLFDRQSGKPLFDIVERAVPASDLRGERAWPTQPFPVKPAPFARQTVGAADVTEQHQRFRTLRGAFFAPPSREGSIVLPGFDGGGEWGGAAVDPETATLYVNASDVPWIAAMRESAVSSPNSAGPRDGAAVYAAVCAACHGPARRGKGRAPSLVALSTRLSLRDVRQILDHGRGFMPSLAALSVVQKAAVIAYLGYAIAPADTAGWISQPATTAPYEFAGYERWRDTSRYPAIKPPWGTLSAIDLNTGEYRWRIPLGEFAALTARGMPVTGTEQYGGPIVTRGGLVFIAATQDAKFRAFDKRTGRQLWEAPLPAPGYATPSTFAVGGKQFIVIAAGGGKLGSKSSDTYVAYALP